ncbi:MAG: hypothetical protein ACI9MR_000736 [Myxococcota bacterium]|jgi:hypothetical protein
MKHILFAVLAVTLVWTPPAQAEEHALDSTGMNLLHGRWTSVSPMFGTGPSQFGVFQEGLSPRVVGIRYDERKGMVTGLFFAVLNSIATGLAANSAKSVRYYRSGPYLVRETTYRSAAERQQMLDDGAEASAAMAEAEDQSFDFEAYATSLPGGGEVSGHKLNMMFGIDLAEEVTLDIGMGFGHSISRFRDDDDRQIKLEHSYFGMPIRLNAALGPLLFWFRWEWNWLGDWSGHEAKVLDDATRFRKQLTGNHWELGLTTALFDHLLLQVGVVTPEITSGEFGFRASAGLRF